MTRCERIVQIDCSEGVGVVGRDFLVERIPVLLVVKLFVELLAADDHVVLVQLDGARAASWLLHLDQWVLVGSLGHFVHVIIGLFVLYFSRR